MNTEKIIVLKTKLSSTLKNKLFKDNERLMLRNKEYLYSEELSLLKTEINLITDQLQDLKSQITHSRHQISLVEICSTSEKCKTETHLCDLNNHKRKIDEMFSKELSKRARHVNAEKEQNAKIEKEDQLAKNEQLFKEINTVEKECDSIERECTILKKRNNAIMLKLRRKLVETENLRKELIKKTPGK